VRLLQPRGVQALLGQQLGQHLLVVDVALLRPDRRQNRAGDLQRGLGTVVQVHRDDQARRIVAVDREVFRLEVQRRM
jgi:hypothetical protein